MVFTQQSLLGPDRFGSAAAERGMRLWPNDLERLHRAGVLVPLYVVRRPIWDINAAVAAKDWTARFEARSWDVSIDGRGLAEDLAAGLVRRGHAVRFRPWASEAVATPTGTVRRREYLYSPYQLLDLDRLERSLIALRATTRTRWERAALARARQASRDAEPLVVLLSAIEVKYRPQIVQHLRGAHPSALEDVEAYRRAFDPVEALSWSGWTADELYESARELLLGASAHDPLDSWHDLVEQVHPDMWERLRGPARLAMDRRIAGEMILRFHEGLQRSDAADPFLAVPRLARHELNLRLRRDRARLDQVLMDFGLAPQPAVVLALEGPTEIAIAHLAMEALGIPDHPSFIELVDSGGERQNHGLLANYVARPSLGPPEGDNAEFTRPPTRYFIVVDGDRRFRTAIARETERQKWVGVMFGGLRPEHRTPVAREELDAFVLLETWVEGLDFERAHFSDVELAAAIIATSCAPPEMSQTALETTLSALRTRGGALDEAWRTWSPRPDKPTIARHAWPSLQRRLEAATGPGELASIPIGRVLLRAYELAASTPRRHVIFRLQRPDSGSDGPPRRSDRG